MTPVLQSLHQSVSGFRCLICTVKGLGNDRCRDHGAVYSPANRPRSLLTVTGQCVWRLVLPS